ncbi:MAG: DUF1501 domain-containing protein [Chloroflexi bacterium]|nr:DUF1501 domain-containing protein [Chloroflexota bacterium]
MNRRDVMQSFGLGVIGLSPSLFPRWMPKLAFAPHGQTANRDVLVAIFQRGGMDGLNAVVPFGEGANYYDRRPTIAIAEPGNGDESAIDLNGFFGLHPALRPLKDVWDAGNLTVIHGAGSPDPSRSHFDAMEFMERGTPGVKTTASGWINRHLQTASWQNDSPFRAVGMGALIQSALRGQAATLALQSISDFHLNGRDDQLAGITSTLASLYSVAAPNDLLQREAAQIYATMDILRELDPDNYQPSYGAQYPDTEFGQALRQIAILIKADLGLEVACVDIGGWDTHENQGGANGTYAGLIGEMGQGLAAFHLDLTDYMSGVTVVTMSEFGRRVTENASEGTDHGHGNVMFMLGGGATSQVYADWGGLATDQLDDGDLKVTTDYRDILSEILIKRLGNNAVDRIFPGYTPSMHDLLTAR